MQAIGAARTVTGSRHLIHTQQSSVLLDCGMFQGHRQESSQRNRDLGFDPTSIDAVVLSHAHIDHSGALPRLCKQGYEGPIYTTAATRDLCAAMLEDAANIQASDARYLNRAIERDGVDAEPIEPLFDREDVARALSQMIALPYGRKHRITGDVALTFRDAGHVLGSALCLLDIDDAGQERRILFTGDLGRRGSPILRDPELPSGASVLIMESTYGDRLHPPQVDLNDQLAAVVQRTHARGGKLVIPSFALERAQQLVYSLKALHTAGKIPALPVYVDSPLTVNITQVFRLHPECYDSGARQILEDGDSPFELPGLRYTASREDSQAIDRSDEPCVVIAASGMCEGGRVLHHLRSTIEDPKNTVLIVGFQAQHTLGRRIVERRQRIRIFGIERELRAEVVVLNGFSAHADQSELLDFASAVRERGPLRDVVLVHGEPAAQDALKAQLTERGFPSVSIPTRDELLRL
ncbi:MAG TPA: MBL fold metallo-hydrolase [Polyangiales bacterium]|nr:MBL fold metallo-hydrolase [Polyangiales bacterium]